MTNLEKLFGLDQIADLSQIERDCLAVRSEFPDILRALALDDYDQITLTISSDYALILADDIEFAAQHNPLGEFGPPAWVHPDWEDDDFT